MRLVDKIVVVDLVTHHDNLLARTTQYVGHHHIEIRNARLDLNHKENQVGLVDSEHNLTADIILENIVGIDGITARVDNRELLAVPVGLAVVAVASGASCLVNDGLTVANQAVEQSRFAHIGATYDCY